jgi:drug/metabolite transporter (DMT)-like permease
MKAIGTYFLYAFALLIVACVLAFVYLLIVQQVPAENRDMVNMALGAFIGSMTTIVSYFFGSSKGSADKNELLRKGD